MAIADDYVRLLKRLLPKGKLWEVSEQSNFKKLLEGMAIEFARLHARSLELIKEVDPRTTVELINEWETLTGLPDPCVSLTQTLQQRRLAVVEKLTRLASLSPRYYIEVARALGYEVSITEFKPFRVGGSKMGDRINGRDWQFTWRVNAPTVTVRVFTLGQSGMGEPLRLWGNEILECAIKRVKPAHTFVVFGFEN